MRINNTILTVFRIVFFWAWNWIAKKLLKKQLEPEKVENMRKIRKFIIHCSASDFGDWKIIDEWHRQKPRNWSEIGYNFVIRNGKLTKESEYDAHFDGEIEIGRSLEKVGAHCLGHNEDSIGICLIGNPKKISKPEDWFTPKQITALQILVKKLMKTYNIPISAIHGHNEFANKICPGFKVQEYLHWFGG